MGWFGVGVFLFFAFVDGDYFDFYFYGDGSELGDDGCSFLDGDVGEGGRGHLVIYGAGEGLLDLV